MTIIVKERDPLVVPLNIRRRAGIKAGDRLEFKAARGIITIVNQARVASDETPEQRRIIDSQLAEGLEDVRKGRVSGPFDTAEEMLASLKGSFRKRTRKAGRTTTTRPAMKWQHSDRSKEDYAKAPAQIQKAFDKQIRLLTENLLHPSLRAKKYSERSICGRRV